MFGFQAEEREAGEAQRRLHIGPGGKDALGQHVRLSVEDVVQDRQAEVGHPQVIHVGEDQGGMQRRRLPVLDDLVELAAGVASGFLDAR